MRPTHSAEENVPATRLQDRAPSKILDLRSPCFPATRFTYSDLGRVADADAAGMTDSPLQRLAFGSCRKQKAPQTIFSSIAARKPEVWLWTGDAVYPRSPTSEEDLRAAYAAVGTSEEERRLLSTVHTVDGVYDDHDFGENDGGRHNPHRELARQLFLDTVLHTPVSSPRRSQRGGLYGSRTFGQPPRQVKVILLDTRFGRADHAVPSIGAWRYLPKPGNCAALVRLGCAVLGVGREHGGEVLAEEQWSWLEGELRNSSAAAHLIVSSIQVLTTSPLVESWGHFPQSRERLLALLQAQRPSAALLLSGDVHHAEFIGPQASVLRRAGGADSDSAADGGNGPADAARLLEVTSSGMTHSCGGSAVGQLLCGTMLRLFSTHRLRGADSRFERGFVGSSYTGLNWGSINFHWGGRAEGRAEGGVGGATDADRLTGAAMEVNIHGADGTVRTPGEGCPMGADPMGGGYGGLATLSGRGTMCPFLLRRCSCDTDCRWACPRSGKRRGGGLRASCPRSLTQLPAFAPCCCCCSPFSAQYAGSREDPGHPAHATPSKFECGLHAWRGPWRSLLTNTIMSE